ncbi:MAG TPA: hypothetical protein VJL60_01890, partial [Gammaproteobacteria bacterium]|nr:hypothetical protein [Gammaproteobacteria bacterium]
TVRCSIVIIKLGLGVEGIVADGKTVGSTGVDVIGDTGCNRTSGDGISAKDKGVPPKDNMPIKIRVVFIFAII